MNCPACDTSNAAESRFCVQCGAKLAAAPTCRACGTGLPAGAKFCTSCGTTVSAAPDIPQGPGYVIDGEWHRAPGELVRKVPGEALRSAFGQLLGNIDWGGFLRGTLVGKVLDLLLSKNIRIPMGSVGVVVKDGRVAKILPPGEQTTAGMLRDLVAGELEGAAGALERMMRPDRVSLYLVDRRPIPVSFTAELPVPTGTKTLQATTLIGVGADKDSLSAFLQDVLGDKDTLSAEDLYVRFRGEIERIVNDALRARPDVPAAEKTARDTLKARFGARTGLSFDLVLAPRHTVHRLDLLLGSGDGLLTADGARVEIDMVMSVQAERAPAPPTGVLTAAASRHLRDRKWADIRVPEGLADLEEALQDASGEALSALGFRVLTLQLVDVRSAGAQWELGARSEMEQARREARLGREWLAVRDDETVLAELTAASELKAEQVRRNATFSARRAQLEDSRRHAAIEAEERALAEQKAQGEHDQRLAAQAREYAAQAQAGANRHGLERQRMDLESERRRRQAEDQAFVEKQRREARLAEVSAMAELDAKMAEQEQQHRLQTMERLAGQSEAQMLAMQASDLATKEHGAAFAEALGKLSDGDQARKERDRADEVQREALKMFQDLAKTSIEANAKVASARAGVAHSCPSCGVALKPGARFCAECGTGLA
jgi:hypothetical protein